MKYEVIINERINSLEKEKTMLLDDTVKMLKTMQDYVQSSPLDFDTFNIMVKYQNEMTIIDRELQLLYDIRKETKAK